MRISVRLEESQSRKLQLLTCATHERTTEVVKRAIDLYFDQVVGARPGAARILREQGFVASGEADPTLSSRYKDLLRDGWGSKHGDR
ncbi:MAG TPA: CopG family transcriptional regulator [Thermoanaerobaculia bacterium]|nr:CopG family transcriptional regulator [Thermoanaerobaculia bacterium]